jgi:catechol 2,3-dioxygenase-like lactoylglutathione lyase family enzyme
VPAREPAADDGGHVDLVVSSIKRSLPFYRRLLEPIGWTGLREVRGEQGETIHYLSVEGPGVSAIGLRQKRSDVHGVPESARTDH